MGPPCAASSTDLRRESPDGPPAASALWVIDSDVPIGYLRDQPQAVAFLEGSEQALAVSAITVAELYAGVRDGEERQHLDAVLGAFTVWPLDLQPAQRAWRMP